MKRLHLALLTGAILGVFCIIGVGFRLGFDNGLLLVATWVNRVVLGLVIGLAPKLKSMRNTLIRGGVFGLVISGSFYLSTAFWDTTGFIAGIVYGVIIEYVATRYAR